MPFTVCMAIRVAHTTAYNCLHICHVVKCMRMHSYLKLQKYSGCLGSQPTAAAAARLLSCADVAYAIHTMMFASTGLTCASQMPNVIYDSLAFAICMSFPVHEPTMTRSGRCLK